MKAASLGLLQILAPAMCVSLLVRVIQTARDRMPALPVLTGTAIVATVYMHYMFFRADIGHFAPAAGPLLIGWGALIFAGHPGPRRRVAAVLGVCFIVLTLGSVGLQRPLARYWMGMEGFRSVAVKGRENLLSAGVARLVSVTEVSANACRPATAC